MMIFVLTLCAYMLFRVLLRNKPGSRISFAFRELDQKLHRTFGKTRNAESYFSNVDSDSSRIVVQLSLDIERELPLLIPQLGRTSTLAIPLVRQKMQEPQLSSYIASLTQQLPAIDLPSIEILPFSLEGIMLPKGSVDLVLLGSGLESVQACWEGRGIQEIFRVLKPGGLLLLVEDFSRIGYRFAQEVKRELLAAGFGSMTLSGTLVRFKMSARKPVPYLT